jgi:hypothetical protein
MNSIIIITSIGTFIAGLHLIGAIVAHTANAPEDMRKKAVGMFVGQAVGFIIMTIVLVLWVLLT